MKHGKARPVREERARMDEVRSTCRLLVQQCRSMYQYGSSHILDMSKCKVLDEYLPERVASSFFCLALYHYRLGRRPYGD